jgi:hypothetical protein
LANANQVYDIASLSLSAGIWLVQANAVFSSTLAATTQYTLDIYNNSAATTLASCSTSHGTSANLSVNASCSAIVNLASTTTVKMRGVSNLATRVVKYQSNPLTLPNASGIVAVRIA